ncbi:helicase C-terminal domain-containing protein, partial [Raoultella planticola]|uniref:helicase C-terminal domain-containing protein n=1 Tax=Raoultella planticola TaxID=575 RepID=UPI0034E48EC9
TMTEWMEKAGRNTFEEITVPQACIKLIQAVGRLIRTETDTGAVTILDSRIKNTRYGQNILDSLPPFGRVIR